MSSTLTSGVRFRLYPAGEVASVLRQWIGCQRFIYSSKVMRTAFLQPRDGLRWPAARPMWATPLDQQYAQFKTGNHPVTARDATSTAC
ncbi:helix-turn-helix domain-containing protein [Paraburkholderia franconis]